MSERYTKLFTLPENLYTARAPAIIVAGALLKDNQTGNVLAQLKLRSISNKAIKAATVSIRPLDTAGLTLGDSVSYQYLDLQVRRDVDFGQKTAIPLPNPATRSFDVIVTEMIFTDNSIWHGNNQPWSVLAKPTAIDFLGDDELAKQFRLEYGNGCENLPLEEKDLWHCICGAINHQEEASCHVCHKVHADLRAIDMDDLRKKKEERGAKERQAAEERTKQEKQDAAERQRRFRKTAAIGTVIAVILAIAICINTKIVVPSGHYHQAEEYLQNGENAKAAIEFGKAGSYSDAKARSFALWDSITQRDVISIGDYHTVGLKNDGTVVATDFDYNYKDYSWSSTRYEGQCGVNLWSDVVAVSAGGEFTVGLRSDGTVVACGNNDKGQCNVNKWRNIVAISAGEYHTVALRSDGTVLATGYNKDGQCNVSGWEDIVAIAASGYHTVGLRVDGTVVTAGERYDGAYDIRDWTDIVYIATGYSGTAGIKRNGTVVATEKYEWSVEGITDAAYISCSWDRCIVLRANGTGEHCLPSCEGMAVLTSAPDGYYGTYIGVRADGTVFSPGAGEEYKNSFGRLNVREWTNIKNPGRIH